MKQFLLDFQNNSLEAIKGIRKRLMEQVKNTIEKFNQSLLLEIFYFKSTNTSRNCKKPFYYAVKYNVALYFFMNISKLLC